MSRRKRQVADAPWRYGQPDRWGLSCAVCPASTAGSGSTTSRPPSGTCALAAQCLPFAAEPIAPVGRTGGQSGCWAAM